MEGSRHNLGRAESAAGYLRPPIVRDQAIYSEWKRSVIIRALYGAGPEMPQTCCGTNRGDDGDALGQIVGIPAHVQSGQPTVLDELELGMSALAGDTNLV